MTSKTNETKITGSAFLYLALYAFAGLGLELLLVLLIEPHFWGTGMDGFDTAQSIIHWAVTCAMWGVTAFLLIRTSKEQYGYDVCAYNKPIKPVGWLVCAAAVTVCAVLSVVSWNGFKVLMEYESRGALLFVFQYVYYAFEALLILLIIAFGQKAGELCFSRPLVPWGGILAAITWGLMHILSKGSVADGLLSMAGGFLYGIIYVATQKRLGISYWLVLAAFIL